MYICSRRHSEIGWRISLWVVIVQPCSLPFEVHSMRPARGRFFVVQAKKRMKIYRWRSNAVQKIVGIRFCCPLKTMPSFNSTCCNACCSTHWSTVEILSNLAHNLYTMLASYPFSMNIQQSRTQFENALLNQPYLHHVADSQHILFSSNDCL